MSVHVISEVFQHSEATNAARLVIIAVADSAHNDGVTWVSQDTLARLTRLSESQVRRSLRDLEQAGEIETRKAQRGKKRVNVYKVTVGSVKDMQPDYDRLPFTLEEPFTTAQIDRSTESDDRANEPVTTAQIDRSLIGRPVTRTVKEEANASSIPRLVKTHDGRNLPFDTLCDVCGVSPTGGRAAEVAVALNGKSGIIGIREQLWRELVAWADTNNRHDSLLRFQEGGADFEYMLQRAIIDRARLYRERMPQGTLLTPTALAKYWTDLPNLQTAGVPDQPLVDYDQEPEA